jgi:glycosyltransferase involved in cell wall biosynthesis
MAYMKSNWFTREAFPQLAARIAALVVLDRGQGAEAAAHGIPPERVRIIRNALAISLPDQASPPAERNGIVFVGRVAPEKRLDTLIAGYARFVTQSGTLPRLDIVGAGDLERCRQLIRDHGVEGHVFLHGHQADVVPFLTRARCYVSASETEGYPNAVLEACATGTPVILSDIPVHREIAGAVETSALLFPHDDPAGLANALRSFFSLDEARLRRLSSVARGYANGFSPEVRNRAYIDCFRDVTEEIRARGRGPTLRPLLKR